MISPKKHKPHPLLAFCESPNVEARSSRAGASDLWVHDLRAMRMPLDRREALAAVVEEFAGAIAGRRAPLTDGAAGIRVVTMLEAADRSLRGEGRRITL